MYPRTNYEMTEAQLNKILDACKPVPYMVIGGRPPRSQQDNANDAWAALGKAMGFDHMTVEPRNGMGSRFFTAVPAENETQRDERLEKERETKLRERVKMLENEIEQKQNELSELLAEAKAIH